MWRSKPLLCSDGAADFPFSGGVDLLKNIFHHIELFVAQYVRKKARPFSSLVILMRVKKSTVQYKVHNMGLRYIKRVISVKIPPPPSVFIERNPNCSQLGLAIHSWRWQDIETVLRQNVASHNVYVTKRNRYLT